MKTSTYLPSSSESRKVEVDQFNLDECVLE